MSNETNGDTVAPVESDSVDQQEVQEQEEVATGISDSVKYETYLRKKKLAENERAGRLAAVERAELAEQKLLEAEGNKDGLIDSLRKQVTSLATKNKEIYGNVTFNTIQSQVEAEASKLGCIDTEALVQLMNIDSFASSVDPETFKANAEEIKAAIEDQKRSRAYLFSKAGPKLNTANPSAELDKGASGEKSFGDMSKAELEAIAKSIDKKEGKTLGWS